MSGRLIIGLGNPGTKYTYTRHNIGFLTIQHFARQKRLKFSSDPVCRGLSAEGILEDHEITLQDVLVVCDDFNLDFGQLRIRRQGTDGGHNGLASIIEHLGSEEFGRLRIGIGAPPEKQDPADFVLEEFDKKEKKYIESMVDEAACCCAAWVTQDMEKVMSQFNKRKENE